MKTHKGTQSRSVLRPSVQPRTQRVLVVMTCRKRLKAVRAKIDVLGLQVVVAPSCRQAQALLHTEPRIVLALTDTSLPDGNWCDILGHAAAQPRPVPVLLISTVGSATLWSEALWRGAYDVLVEPFETSELSRAVDGALRSIIPLPEVSAATA